MASPMSPLSLSFPDMKAICPFSFPPIMSSQSGDAMVTVRSAAAAGPAIDLESPADLAREALHEVRAQPAILAVLLALDPVVGDHVRPAGLLPDVAAHADVSDELVVHVDERDPGAKVADDEQIVRGCKRTG